MILMTQDGLIKARGWMLVMIDPEKHVLCVDAGTGTIEIDMVSTEFPQLSNVYFGKIVATSCSHIG